MVVSCSQAIGSMAKINVDAMQPYATKLAQHLASEVPGRFWDGKENVLQALGTLCAACPNETARIGSELVNVVAAATGRGKKAFKEEAVKCLTKLLDSFSDQDHFNAVGTSLLAMVDRYICRTCSAQCGTCSVLRL